MIDRVSLKRYSKERMSKHRPSVYLVTLVFLAIVTVLSILTEKLSGVDTFVSSMQGSITSGSVPTWEDVYELIPNVTFFASLLVFLIDLVSSVIVVGYMGFCLKVHRGQEAGIGSIFDEFGHFFKIIWLQILMGVFTLLWTLLFIIPGIIASYRYRLARYVLIDHPEFSALDCIRESKRLMTGHKMDLFVMDLSFIGWAIVGGFVTSAVSFLIKLSIPLFSIWLEPYTGLTYAGFYIALAFPNGSEPVSSGNDSNAPDWEYKQ